MNSEMKLSFFQSMRGKILIAFLVITLIPLGIVGVLAVLQAEKALQNAATNQLEAVMEVKKDWIESQLAESANDVHLLTETADALREEAFDALQSTLAMKKLQLQLYFQERKSDISVMAKSDRVFAALQAFESAVITGTVGSAEWEAVEVEYGRWLQEFNDNYGYADTYLVNPEGLIVYTAKNKAELGESLTSGPLQNSGVAQAFRGGLEGFTFQDFSLYAPADDSPSAFLATPVINENNLLLGVMMVRIEAAMINTIMLERTGLGATGETYLVGPDFRMRSDSYLDPVDHSVAASLAGTVTDNGVDTEASRAALAGKSGVDVLKDYRSTYVLSAYAPVTLVGGIQWAMLAEMDMGEAFIPTFDSADDDYYRRYIANHEMFEDLLLVTPDGVVFYSAAQAEDYGTNLLNGPYRDTALGELVAEVLETGTQTMVDFAPYPPADNKPVAFLAAPIIYEEHVAMVLAARMPVDEIDRVMQQREGMGETGETVLVGPDMRMRSDSVTDPVGHSVAASFAGTPEENGITSSAVQAGLAGETGVEELVDYRGETVLEAYAPVRVSDDLTWAILAKQDRAEAYQDAATLQTLMLGVGGATAVAVVIVALILASSLSRPVVKITGAAQAVANGDLDVEAEVKSRDETGILARAFNQMVSQLREMLSNEQARRQRLQLTVEEYVSHMAIVGQGNLAARLDVGGNGHNPNDPLIRLGQNLNDLTANLQQMILQIREAANNLSSASTEIMAATTQQASGASEQSAAITQTTTTVDEVKTISEQAIVRAQEVADSSQRTVEVSRGGMQAVQETMQSMAQIKERVEGIAENILALSEQTQQIGEITSTVNDIASQSNMLALNASVEAARAGEHGKGFAVVAVEVRNLAEQSKQATAQVRAILTDIQNAINATVMVTEEGTKVVDLGVQLAQEARGAIEQLAAVINESAQTATQVVAGGQQQASGVEQIAMAMQNINQAMMQSMASTRQAEKAAQDLNELARRLNDTVQEYTLEGKDREKRMSISSKVREQLLNSFRAELAEHIQTITDGLLTLEQQGHTQGVDLDAIFRAAHSLKGAARAVGATVIEQLAHALEDMLDGLRKESITPTPDFFNACYRAMDAIQAVQADYEAGAVTPSADALQVLQGLEAFRRAPAPTGQESRAPAATEERPPSRVSAPPGTPELDETIRVKVSKLDALMAQLSELFITKIQAEQRLAQLREIEGQMALWQKEWLSVRSAYTRLLRQEEKQNNGKGEGRDWSQMITYVGASQEYLREMHTQLSDLSREYANDTMHMSLVIDELEEEVKRVRMLPLHTITPTFGRMVRDLAKAAGKEAVLRISGGETELDKRVLEQIKDPLIHLLRNAVDHGIETPEKREAAGKARTGHITLTAEQLGRDVVITVADDGSGLDIEAIREAVTERKSTLERELGEAELVEAIFDAGISTSAFVTDISGRGIGLDVVRRNIEDLRGRISVDWAPGGGTEFTLVLPVTLSSSRGLLVRTAGERYAVPLNAIERILTVRPEQVTPFGGQSTILYRERPLTLMRLSDVLELPDSGAGRGATELVVVVLAAAERRMAFIVDELVGEQEIVIKPLGKQLASVGGLAGATVLGSGEIVLILSAADLMKLALREGQGPLHLQRDPDRAPAKERHRRHILIVDDSITTRTLEKNILEAAGYSIQVATDGQEAWNLILASSPLPDLVISDVSMPRLDGIGLTRRIREETRMTELPVILVTSLDSPTDKARGVEAGADAYITKGSFDQHTLLDVVEQLI